MAATGKTPILLYGSTTATNQPSAGNLTNSSDGCEIAINVADKNLFFKDATNTVNTVPIRQSSASSDGWLSSTDWSTFNSKQPAGSYLTSVIVDAPLTGAGTSGSHLSIPAASGSTNGYLTSADWTTFNNKQAALVSGSNIKTVGGNSLLGSGNIASFNTDVTVNSLTVGKGGSSLTESTAVGVNALASVTSGTGNSGFGYDALLSVSTGAQNSAFGAYSQYSATGSYNTSVGYYSAPLATGNNNVVIGNSAATSGSFSGSNNTIAGANAGRNTTTGGANAYYGFSTGYSTTTGYANVAIGGDFPGNYSESTLHSNQTGVGNVAIGASALRLATAGYNTAIGLAAGTSITSGTQNIYLGAYAGASGATVTNEIVIGYNTSGNGSNTITLGNSSHTGVYLPNSNLVIGTSGKGIDFSATAGTGTSELLADYEEGTWTPTLFLGSTEVASYSAHTGFYTKIGRQVFVQGEIDVSSAGAGSGGLSIQGLPYTGKSGAGASCFGIGWPYSGWSGLTAGGAISLQLYTSAIYLYQQTTTGVAQMTSGNVTNSSVIAFSLTYIV